MTHVFADSLKRSHAYSDAPWWEEVYRAAFVDYGSMTDCRDNGWWQQAGIDRAVHLTNGRSLWIDEKVRAANYPDIILERWSDRQRRREGWVQKKLAADYIAYAFVPSRRCYLLPFQQLRRAWRSHGREWIAMAEDRADGFAVVLAENEGYTTESIAVPIPALMDAIRSAQIVTEEDK